jgi:hypothetical protein
MTNARKVAPADAEPKPATRPNLRHYHRISTQFDAVIKADGDSPAGEKVLECQLTNLSRAGVMAKCTPEMVKALLPKGAAVGPRQAVKVQVQFELPVISVQKVLIEAQCDVIYLRRVSRDTFHLGMSFTAFDNNNGQDYIDQYIDRKLHPPGS